MRYEDLCARPEDVTEEVFRFLGVEPERVLGPPRRPERHHLMGNRMLRSFDGSVRLDTSWRALADDELAATLRAAGSLARRYGYA